VVRTLLACWFSKFEANDLGVLREPSSRQGGEILYTRKRRPVVLVFTETYDRIVDAIERERQIKGWSRAKKEALIALDYVRLPELARNRQGVGYVKRWPPAAE
jgi:predicted GIY-YIG superfamily endonuclease